MIGFISVALSSDLKSIYFHNDHHHNLKHSLLIFRSSIKMNSLITSSQALFVTSQKSIKNQNILHNISKVSPPSRTTSTLSLVSKLRLSDINRGRLHVLSPDMTSTFQSVTSESEEGLRIKQFVECELQVRDYEIDQFGVVNNAVYSRYCQHGHHAFFRSVGLGMDADRVAQNGQALVLANMSFKFCAPLKSGDKFVVKVRVSSISDTRILLEDFIYRLPDNKLVVVAKATAVWLDRNYNSMRIPSDPKEKFLQAYFAKNI